MLSEATMDLEKKGLHFLPAISGARSGVREVSDLE